jgi:DNA-directed RNA polymerase subunit omega
MDLLNSIKKKYRYKGEGHMLEPSVKLMKEKADSRYTLAVLAAKRARDIIDGKPVLIDIDINKPVSVAVNEIAENLITYTR